MKRALLAIVSLCAAPAMAHAQDGGFGIKGGLSYGNVSNSGALPGNISQRSGFAVGVSAVTGGMLGFGIEGLYAQRGVTSSTIGASRSLDYIDVPVYLRLSMPTPGISPFGYVGPQASYELKCGTDSGNCPDTGRPKITYSGVVGAGLRFAALGNVSLEARYIYGLTDLKLSTVSTSNSYQTRSFMLLAGFGF
ncbi:MAG: PorT family protein [Proteobacteria bacterium]|nr:PorT family protein [Pseudomonadota bacterium]